MAKFGQTTNHRLVALCAGFILLLGVLWVRCLWLQVFQAGRLLKLAEAQYRVSRELPPQRGTIYDATGRVLAMSARVPSVFANPRHVHAKHETAAQLASLVGRDPRLIGSRLAQDRGFVWIARQVDPSVTDRLGPFRTHGVGMVEEPKRVYPQGEMASHLLGFVDIDQKGLEGLELAMNGSLRGRPGWLSTLRDAKGDVLIGPWTKEMQPEDGLDVFLTIDAVCQGIAEDALAWGVTKFHAKGGSVIVMDPYTGRVLAMATRPTFDPNDPGRARAETRRNRAITDLAEPGSVFKVVTASALLNEGVVRPDERVFCENGSYQTAGHHVLHDHTAHGWLTFHDVMQYSSNIGTAKMAQRLKPDVLYRYIRAFGFGQRTGIELPGEVSGIVPPPTQWSKLSPYIIPIGQEVAVTPIQMAVMTAAIANGGWKVSPSIVDRVRRIDGKVMRGPKLRPRERILKAETAHTVQEMLIGVVASGTGRLASVQGLIVAGKTGTAQKLEPTGHYSHSLFVASFVGYGPVPDPRVVIAVSIDEPHPLYFGGVVAAPVFKRIIQRLASYWDLKRTL